MMLDKNFWEKINANVVARYREAIFDNVGKGEGARDVFGDSYPTYSTGYAIKKQSGLIKRQKASFKNSTAPVLSGDLFNDFELRKTDAEGFTFGTKKWGSKVKNLEKLGRPISTNKKVLPDKVEDYILLEAIKYATKEWKRKNPKKNITIDLNLN